MNKLAPEKQGVFLRASVSDICNFSCQYCALDLGMENHTPACLHAPLLTAEQYIRNLRLMADHGFKMVSFTGGEPLLNADFQQIAEGCRDCFDVIEITTNATRIAENMEALKKYVDTVKISTDAFDRELAVKIAGNRLAANTLNAIRDCCEAGIKTIGLNFVYMKQNAAELPKIIDFAGALKKKYRTNIYISILDLYFSAGNKAFWEEQFVDLSVVRRELEAAGRKLNRRLRIGCDSYNYIWNDVLINMKDSFSCTHRAAICDKCAEYCQEGIYSLKHSASGWISVCPSNNPALGSLLGAGLSDNEAHDRIDPYINILNEIRRTDNTGEIFMKKHGLQNSGGSYERGNQAPYRQ